MDFEFGQSDKAEAFFDRHPKFWEAFDRMMTVSNKCFGRRCDYTNQAEALMFSLGQTCREDFLEIVFLAVHGFSTGATKLLRGLYERAVTHAYIIQHPEKVMQFIRFGAIQEYRVMKGALEAGVSEKDFNERMTPENSIEKITERRNQVKEEFKVKECDVCGMEAPPSWDKQSIGAMARKAGDLYKALYLGGYAMTNLHIHATFTSAVYLEDTDKKTAEAIREREAHANIGQAFALLYLVLKEQNGLFNLGLEQDLEAVEKSIALEWFEKEPG